MKDQNGKQENHFDLHEEYASVEEVELELSRIVDACMEVVKVLEESHLPFNLRYGVVMGTFNGYFKKLEERLNKNYALETLFGLMMGGKHE